ncbi:MAG: hypothetical protein AAB071_04820, partial [Bacteroidota bacterium]
TVRFGRSFYVRNMQRYGLVEYNIYCFLHIFARVTFIGISVKINTNSVRVNANPVKVNANSVKVNANPVKVNANSVKVNANSVKVNAEQKTHFGIVDFIIFLPLRPFDVSKRKFPQKRAVFCTTDISYKFIFTHYSEKNHNAYL